ncbi:olfactory receptor 10A7-like [Paroedura picta]|uniref:olfactory receptor 10A7-like n=1 Tax=Paroedura picta TaxID=143630 RepID=UPI004055C89D
MSSDMDKPFPLKPKEARLLAYEDANQAKRTVTVILLLVSLIQVKAYLENLFISATVFILVEDAQLLQELKDCTEICSVGQAECGDEDFESKEGKGTEREGLGTCSVENADMMMANRDQQNQTTVTEFILLGFGGLPKLQILLFLLFLVIYLATMAGNFIIIVLVVTVQHLHTPMYFFLGNLAFLEICFSSTILPKMLLNLWTGERNISFKACFIQFFIFTCMGGTECYLLSMMSYDRYLAICKPLHYATLMNGRFCLQLVAVSWVSGVLVSTSLTLKISLLSFCGPNEMDNYVCDISSEIRSISCSDTHSFELSSFISACVFTLPPFLLILSSYIFIIVSILRISSTTGRRKAFSTCSSHLTMIALYYGTIMLVYMVPRSRNLREMKKIVSLFYTILIPMVNPLIYSLRNKEVREARRKCMKRFIKCMT